MAKDKILKPFVGIIAPENKFTVDTIDDLKSKTYLTMGDIVDLNGYYIAGDGARHKRKIESADDGSGVQLANGLWANIVHNGEVDVSWFGAKGDGVTDDYSTITKSLNYSDVVKFKNKNYFTSKTIVIGPNKKLIGDINRTKITMSDTTYKTTVGGTVTILGKSIDTNINAIFEIVDTTGASKTCRNIVIENFTLESSATTGKIEYGLFGTSVAYSVFKNIYIVNCNKSLTFADTFLNEISKVDMTGFTKTGFQVIAGGTSTSAERLYCVNATGTAFDAYNLVYSTFKNFACDNVVGDFIYKLYHGSTTLENCGMENCKATKPIFLGGANGSFQINNFHALSVTLGESGSETEAYFCSVSDNATLTMVAPDIKKLKNTKGSITYFRGFHASGGSSINLIGGKDGGHIRDYDGNNMPNFGDIIYYGGTSIEKTPITSAEFAHKVPFVSKDNNSYIDNTNNMIMYHNVKSLANVQEFTITLPFELSTLFFANAQLINVPNNNIVFVSGSGNTITFKAEYSISSASIKYFVMGYKV